MGRRGSLIPIVYLVIGAFVAGSKDYFDNLESLERIISALLAIGLWPLLFLGIDFNVRL